MTDLAWVVPKEPLDDVDVAADHAAYHIERMSDTHIWLVVRTPDGGSLVLNLHSGTPIRVLAEEYPPT